LVGRPVLLDEGEDVLEEIADVLLDDSDELAELVEVELDHAGWASAHNADKGRHDL
jgi:hypothetical protein